MTDSAHRKAIAAFRYQAIAPLVQGELPRGEYSRRLHEIADELMEIDGRPLRIHPRTLQRWVARYRSGSMAGLMPDPPQRKGVKRLPAEVIERAVALRQELPGRSVQTVIRILEREGLVETDSVRRTTLGRHLRARGCSGADLQRDRDSYRRFEAPVPNALWQADTQHSLSLPDPLNPGRRRKTYLICILDDCSRLVYGRFYLHDNRPMLEDALKHAMLLVGVPAALYVDNGSNYRSTQLRLALSELGVHLRHATVRRPLLTGQYAF